MTEPTKRLTPEHIKALMEMLRTQLQAWDYEPAVLPQVVGVVLLMDGLSVLDNNQDDDGIVGDLADLYAGVFECSMRRLAAYAEELRAQREGELAS
jgi:hypothetical protein